MTTHKPAGLLLVLLLTVALLGQAAAAPSSRRADDDGFWFRRAALDRFSSVRANRSPSHPENSTVLNNFDIVGHLGFRGKTPEGDVWFYDHGGTVGKYAYVGSWSYPCTGRGVHIVNVNDPSNPLPVGRARLARSESSYEDAVVIRIGNKDVLGVGVQGCGRGRRGLALFNVTDPARPRLLSFTRVPANGVHELDLVARPDGRVLALLAVPFAEGSRLFGPQPQGGDFRIVDITRPREPVKLSTWGVVGDSSLPIPHGTSELESLAQGLGYAPFIYAHSVRGADNGMTAYVSYWDAGVLKFDISNPSAPRLVARTTYPLGADGDAHSLTTYDVGGQRYILQNDEDIDPLSPVTITSTATGNERYEGVEEPWMPTLLTETGEITAEVHDAGDGCVPADFAGAQGKIALIDVTQPGDTSPPCPLGGQILRAARAGAAAILLNFVGPERPLVFYQPSGEQMEKIGVEAASIPAVMTGSIDGLASQLRTRLTNRRVSVTLTPNPPSWGFVRVYGEATGRDLDGDGVVEYTQAGSFNGLAHVTGEFPPPPGVWSVHNTEVFGTRAYSSWYSHGVVALDLTDPTAPVLAGQFARPSERRASVVERAMGSGAPYPLVWGVAVDPETGLVYASDMRSGLWIVRPTGAAAATG